MLKAFTKDGVEFKLGMSLYTDSTYEEKTSEETHELTFIKVGNQTDAILRLKDDDVSKKVNTYYSTPFVAIDMRIAELEEKKKNIDGEIVVMENYRKLWENKLGN